ncbi:unnamed protein product [Clavelina lepadiformis]|uniref:Bromo domain-containing protein n=1 Tax=Clavelina lepadiformis TaxID=159417 RepID=A0ABP0FGT2_CLALP
MGKKHKKHKSSGWQHADDYGSSDKTPLKLVLKLGSEVMYDSDHPPGGGSSHKRKKRKKKRHREEEEERDSMLVSPESRSMTPDMHGHESDVELSSSETRQDKTAETIIVQPEIPPIKPVTVQIEKFSKVKPPRPFMSKAKRNALNNLLEHILKQLERKDPHEVFAWPVNDMIAPGYSSMISEPMDFSTMRNKIITNQYFDVNEFKRDFELMINNCCTYNKLDTIYYEIAKKVLAAGMKIMSRERLKHMKRTLSFLNDLSKKDISDILVMPMMEEESIEVEAAVPESIPRETKSDVSEMECDLTEGDLKAHPDAVSFTDADNEDTVAPDAIQAMKRAQKKLADTCPKNRMGFLRMDDDGKTTLSIVNPEFGEERSREVDLGSLTSHLVDGIDIMPEPKEDKRNKVTPIQYLSYGPFSSYAPSYDSRISNLTKDESDLLLSAYGSETGYMFANSMQEFVSTADKGLLRMVGDLLDTVTHHAHSQAYQDIEAKRRKQSNDQSTRKSEAIVSTKPSINFDNLRSLKELGIDVSFVDEIESKQVDQQKAAEKQLKTDRSIHDSLNKGSVLIKKLEQAQYQRLSQKAPNNEPNLKPPDDKEQQIALELQKTLADLTATTSPRSVLDQSALRQTLGVTTTV